MGTQVNVNLNAETFKANRDADKQLYLQLVGRAENGWLAQSATGTVSSAFLGLWRSNMDSARNFVLENLAGVFNVNDMQKYARSEYSSSSLDYFSLYQVAWAQALDAAIAWIDANGQIDLEDPVDIDTTDLTPLLQAVRTAQE